MPVRIDIKPGTVTAHVMGAWKKGLALLSNEILNDCNQYVKWDSGDLMASSLTNSKLSEGKLIWQKPYAKRQYWEIKTAYKIPNPNATWKWCEVAKKRCIDRWQQQAQKILEMNL